MSDNAVLIAAYSGRALAASARRAGFAPLVVDGYGDLDTIEAAEHHCRLREFVTTGITAKPLLAALADIALRTKLPVAGLVLGAGFEDHPKLMDTLASTYKLLGTSAAATRRCKMPAEMMMALSTLGASYPKTQLTPPPRDATGWLIKRTGGSGGRHVRDWTPTAKFIEADYFQKKSEGDAISVLGIVSPDGDAFAFSRQWCAPYDSGSDPAVLGSDPLHRFPSATTMSSARGLIPSTPPPYRYGGATGPLTLEEDLEARLIDTSLAVAREFNLIGMVSFDFIVNETEVNLIDINPRSGATLDIFDDDRGTLFAAHIAACTGANPVAILQENWTPPVARSSSYLYADRGALTVPNLAWPEWTRDRSPQGTKIHAHEPIATVIAEAETPDEAERLCGERLGILQSMMYDSTV